MTSSLSGNRVAIIGGCRTPFCKAGTLLKDVTAVDLARRATIELVHRLNLNGDLVDEMYFGQVLASPLAPNLAREVSLLPQFPASIPAASVNRACASANTAIAQGADQIRQGYANVVIACGAESLSNVPILHSRRFSETLMGLSKAKNIAQRLKLIGGIRPRDLIPVAPALMALETWPSIHPFQAASAAASSSWRLANWCLIRTAREAASHPW